MRTVVLVILGAVCLFGQATFPANKALPAVSGGLNTLPVNSNGQIGIGNFPRTTCTIGTATQPGLYSGNMLVDCDDFVHEETAIAVNPGSSTHAVGGFNVYRLTVLQNQVDAILSTGVSATFDGGLTWRETTPPIDPYQSSYDPSVTFDSRGRVYFGGGALRGTGPGGTNGDVIVRSSDDGGVTWSRPTQVALGKGGSNILGFNQGSGPQTLLDKPFLTADAFASSPHRDRLYSTWTSFELQFDGPHQFYRSPIATSSSDDGVNWATTREISGFSPHCTVTFSGAPNECDLNQGSYPAVAPNGRVYVAFENFNTTAENQFLIVTSGDGGATWSSPIKMADVFDINLPVAFGRSTLTGCLFRVSSTANVVVDPSDPTGRTLYAVWADNRNGTATATNMNVFLARSSDGGSTWSQSIVDSAANDQFYPFVSVASNGRVDIGYMDRSYSSGQSVCQYGFSLTRLVFDPGTGTLLTKTKTRVDTALSNPDHHLNFIGDYTGVAVAPDGSTYSLWTDIRSPGPPHAVASRTAP